MSTRALLGVYVNGKLTKTYFHHWDGYVSYLGNILITFNSIVRQRLNDMNRELTIASQKKRNAVMGVRSPIDLLQPLLDAEGGFEDAPDFKDYWCLEYIYRINFVFHPTEHTLKWGETLDYSKTCSKLSDKWKKENYIPLQLYEGVHYKGENKLHIDPKLKQHYEPADLTTD